MVPQPLDQPKGKKVVNSDTDHYLYHRNNTSFTISIRSTHITSSFFYMCPSFQTRKKSINFTQIHAFETKNSTLLTLSKHKALLISIYYLFFFRSGFFLSIELHKSSRILCTTTTDLRIELLFSFSSQQSQFQVPAIEPFVGTGADPGFNASKTHQQNPNYRPFRQHLRNR